MGKRYWIQDLRTGTVTCVEPIHERNQKANDKAWSNGGIQGVLGGSVAREDSTISPETHTNIREENGSGL